MTIELWALLVTGILAASLWIPFIVGVNLHLPETEQPGIRPPNLRLLPDWVQRANRAHLNLIEQALPFAMVVLVAHAAGVSTAFIQGAALAFVCLRAVHAVGYITGWTGIPARPILFTLAWVMILVIAVEIVRVSFGSL